MDGRGRLINTLGEGHTHDNCLVVDHGWKLQWLDLIIILTL